MCGTNCNLNSKLANCGTGSQFVVVFVKEETRVSISSESVSFNLSKSLSFGINQQVFVNKVRVK